MNAIELLKKQHLEVSDLFARFDATSDKAKKRALFETIAAALVAHDAIEREIFYPACEREMGKGELLGESVVEHGVIELTLHRADLNRRKEAFDDHVTVLKEMVRHHVDEEEDELFPKVVRALGKTRLDKLGPKMWARYREVVTSDFRPALRDAVTQLLEGATKTKPKKRAAKVTRKPGRTAAARAHTHVAH